MTGQPAGRSDLAEAVAADPAPAVIVHVAQWDGPAVPDGAVVMNAPRPLLGEPTWQGTFRHGAFYAATTDPELYRLNRRDDAHVVELVDNGEVRRRIDARLTAAGYTRDDTTGIADDELAAMYELPWHEE